MIVLVEACQRFDLNDANPLHQTASAIVAVRGAQCRVLKDDLGAAQPAQPRGLGEFITQRIAALRNARTARALNRESK